MGVCSHRFHLAYVTFTVFYDVYYVSHPKSSICIYLRQGTFTDPRSVICFPRNIIRKNSRVHLIIFVTDVLYVTAVLLRTLFTFIVTLHFLVYSSGVSGRFTKSRVGGGACYVILDQRFDPVYFGGREETKANENT